MRRTTTAILSLLAALAVLTGCGASHTKSERADRFTAAVRDSGLAPEMTPKIAASLYGEDGGAICAALRDNPAGILLSWGRTTLTHTPGDHADDLIAYDRHVVEVYCPDKLDVFNDLSGRINR
ncbi:hypothetical protein [Kitasatospora sp. NPDC004531]